MKNVAQYEVLSYNPICHSNKWERVFVSRQRAVNLLTHPVTVTRTGNDRLAALYNGAKMKKCGACGLQKDESCFHRKSSAHDGLSSHCKSCKSSYDRWLSENPSIKRVFKNGKPKKRKIRTEVFSKYGITLYDYEAMELRQNGVCAICGQPPKYPKTRLCVDHDHQTGKVRGLLCNECNVVLGAAKDSEVVLQKMIDYLIRAK